MINSSPKKLGPSKLPTLFPVTGVCPSPVPFGLAVRTSELTREGITTAPHSAVTRSTNFFSFPLFTTTHHTGAAKVRHPPIHTSRVYPEMGWCLIAPPSTLISSRSRVCRKPTSILPFELSRISSSRRVVTVNAKPLNYGFCRRVPSTLSFNKAFSVKATLSKAHQNEYCENRR